MHKADGSLGARRCPARHQMRARARGGGEGIAISSSQKLRASHFYGQRFILGRSFVSSSFFFLLPLFHCSTLLSPPRLCPRRQRVDFTCPSARDSQRAPRAASAMTSASRAYICVCVCACVCARTRGRAHVGGRAGAAVFG